MRKRSPGDWGLTTPKQQQRGVQRLILLSAVILGLTLATRDRGDDERSPTDLPDTPPEEVVVKEPSQGIWGDEAPPRSTIREGAKAPIEVTAAGQSGSLEETLADAPLEDCHHQWWMLQPDLEEVDLVVSIVDGNPQAHIADHEQVPETVLSCFGQALAGRPWPTKGEITLTLGE